MDEVWKIVLGVLTSVGGISGLIIVVVKFSAGTIAKRLEEEYSLKLSKELEQYKSRLDNKIYISRTKFDTEFIIYRELSKAFFEMVKDIGRLIPSGYTTYPADKDARKKYEEDQYSKALKTTVIAQDSLHSNAPFIPENLFIKYNEIVKLCQMQLSMFDRRWNVLYFASQEEKETFSPEDYKRTDSINEKFKDLNTHIREYLLKLDVLD